MKEVLSDTSKRCCAGLTNVDSQMETAPSPTHTFCCLPTGESWLASRHITIRFTVSTKRMLQESRKKREQAKDAESEWVDFSGNTSLRKCFDQMRGQNEYSDVRVKAFSIRKGSKVLRSRGQSL